ncbi:hypothetical protein K458DRAFT_387254 [Lentithecium fluviatile CBS 122367]|uniref:Uncharacterized protein n=1 Tax=Lentithecium fluviatile CBS 122367 TaxID=1168545 RepID=A0A6G1J7Q7_9PLEO|nr:hypothetical protein K458DRAFT_387254 [Lentithecium fluviatile CBS 122367]
MFTTSGFMAALGLATCVAPETLLGRVHARRCGDDAIKVRDLRITGFGDIDLRDYHQKTLQVTGTWPSRGAGYARRMENLDQTFRILPAARIRCTCLRDRLSPMSALQIAINEQRQPRRCGRLSAAECYAAKTHASTVRGVIAYLHARLFYQQDYLEKLGCETFGCTSNPSTSFFRLSTISPRNLASVVMKRGESGATTDVDRYSDRGQGLMVISEFIDFNHRYAIPFNKVSSTSRIPQDFAKQKTHFSQ